MRLPHTLASNSLCTAQDELYATVVVTAGLNYELVTARRAHVCRSRAASWVAVGDAVLTLIRHVFKRSLFRSTSSSNRSKYDPQSERKLYCPFAAWTTLSTRDWNCSWVSFHGSTMDGVATNFLLKQAIAVSWSNTSGTSAGCRDASVPVYN